MTKRHTKTVEVIEEWNDDLNEMEEHWKIDGQWYTVIWDGRPNGIELNAAYCPSPELLEEKL